MTMVYYFLKKLSTSKFTLMLRIIILAVGTFLVALFLTLGFNASDKINSLFDRYPNYTILYAEPASFSTNEIYKGREKNWLLAIARSNYELLQEIDGVYVEIPVTEYRSDSDLVYVKKNMIAGSADRVENAMWIGKSVLDTLGYTPDEVIGKEVILMNAGVQTIVGVFDDSDGIVSSQCIVYTDEVFLPQMYYIDACSVNEVQAIIDDLTASDYKVFSHINEIKSVQSYARMTKYAVLFVSILIISASSVILYSSLKASIEEMYTFLALLKAIGYTNKNCALYVVVESLIICLCSTAIFGLLYIFCVPVIRNILVAGGVRDLFGIIIDELFVRRFGIFGLSVAITAVAVVIVSFSCVRFVSQKHVYEVFYEGNQ